MPFVMCRQYDAPPSPYVAHLPTLLLQVLLPFIYSASATVAVAAPASGSTVMFDYLINGLGRLLRKQTAALFYGWLIKQSSKGWETEGEGERRRKAVGVLETGWHATDACEEIFT